MTPEELKAWWDKERESLVAFVNGTVKATGPAWLGVGLNTAWLAVLTASLLFHGCGSPTPPPAPPAPPPAAISLPDKVQGPVGRVIPIEASTDGADVHWWCDESSDLVVMAGTKKAAFVSPKPGKYTVLAWTALKGKPTDAAVCTVTVGDPPPPVPPVPPVPPPPKEFRVLIVYDASQSMPALQVKALTDPAVRSYLDAHCVKEGTQPAYRVWEKNTQITKEADVWKNVWARPRASLPWVVIGTGADGFEGPLPQDSAALLDLLKKYGGS